MEKVLIEFSKAGIIRYISHLDLMRVFARAIRRAGLPVKLSEGFNPRLRISFARALKLGAESKKEEATFQLDGPLSTEDFKIRLGRELPPGIEIQCIRKV